MSTALPSTALLAFALLVPAPAALSGALRIELASSRIQARDLAAAIPVLKGADPEAELGYAPLPGIERRVSRHELFDWIEDLGLAVDAKTLPETLILTRKMRRLSSEQVRALVTAAVAGRYRVVAGDVDIEFHGFDEPLVPAQDLDYELTSTLTRLGRPTSLTLRWTNGEGRSGNLSFRATPRIRGAYAVAREALPARTEVSAADFRFEQGFLPGNPDEYLVAPAELEGKRIRQAIEAGEALEKRLLQTALTVKRGDLIELRLQTRAVLLRAPGRAEQSGATGEVIRCRNLQSDTTVRAEIIDSRQAEVIAIR